VCPRQAFSSKFFVFPKPVLSAGDAVQILDAKNVDQIPGDGIKSATNDMVALC